LFQGLVFIIFNFSIFLIIAAALEIFRIVSWLEHYHTIEHDKEKKRKSENEMPKKISGIEFNFLLKKENIVVQEFSISFVEYHKFILIEKNTKLNFNILL
jgi:hypothetical protein